MSAWQGDRDYVMGKAAKENRGWDDDRGTTEYNLALGDRRANAAREYLVSLGVDASRIRTVSYGKERPFCTAETEECWQQNRRAHFLATAK